MRQSGSQRAVKESIRYTAADSKDWNLARSDTKGVPSKRAIAKKILLKGEESQAKQQVVK